jgi:hypothetical protein
LIVYEHSPLWCIPVYRFWNSDAMEVASYLLDASFQVCTTWSFPQVDLEVITVLVVANSIALYSLVATKGLQFILWFL